MPPHGVWDHVLSEIVAESDAAEKVDWTVNVDATRSYPANAKVPAVTEAYKGRNVVERSFTHLKQWRGLATTYRSTATLRTILRWLKVDIGDMP